MSRGTPGEQIESAITSLVRWASRESVREQMLVPDARGLSANDVWLLGVLADLGPIQASALARLQGVDKSTVTAQVRRLERHGLVSRHGHPEDRRVVLLEASERGRQLRGRLRAQGAAIIDQALAAWSERDRRSLGVLLERLGHSLQATTAAPSADAPFVGGGP
jgi:DNA-binding MarR family transcriptional regulator